MKIDLYCHTTWTKISESDAINLTLEQFKNTLILMCGGGKV